MKKANNSVIIVGRNASANVFFTYRINGSDGLEATDNETQLPWGFGTKGMMDSGFFALKTKRNQEFEYQALVFNPTRSSIYAFVSTQNMKRMVVKRLKSSGKWTKKWKMISSHDFDGLFNVAGVDYGLNINNSINQIYWKDGNAINAKEVGCF